MRRRIRRNQRITNAQIAAKLQESATAATKYVMKYFTSHWEAGLAAQTYILIGTPEEVTAKIKSRGGQLRQGYYTKKGSVERFPKSTLEAVYPWDTPDLLSFRKVFSEMGKPNLMIGMSPANAEKNKIVIKGTKGAPTAHQPLYHFMPELKSFLNNIVTSYPVPSGKLGILKLLSFASRDGKDWKRLKALAKGGQRVGSNESAPILTTRGPNNEVLLAGIPAKTIILTGIGVRHDLLELLDETVDLPPITKADVKAKIADLKGKLEHYLGLSGTSLPEGTIQLEDMDLDILALKEPVEPERPSPRSTIPPKTKETIEKASEIISVTTGISFETARSRLIMHILQDPGFVVELQKLCREFQG